MSERIVIAGCRGRMGAMLMERLSRSAAFQPVGLDLPYDEEDMEQACRGARVVLLCIPATAIAGTVEKLRPFMEPSTILSDITSVKELPMQHMESLWDGPVVGTHPLFGPVPAQDLELRVTIVPGRHASEEDVEAVRAYAGQDYTFSDRRLDNQEAAGAYYSFVLFIYGFLAIIAMITVFNIMNSVSMSVSARMKQYGAMRAVGMDMAQMKRMIYAETFTYAISGTLAGIVLGIPLHRFSWQNLIYNQWKDPWIFPVLALIVIVSLVIVSCILVVRNPLKRIENMSVVDVISEQ